jgi:hypothetical protein
MRTAAWRACAPFVRDLPAMLGDPGRLRIGDVRGMRFQMEVDGRAVPLGATLLPVDQNMRQVDKAVNVRNDAGGFLGRLGWHPRGPTVSGRSAASEAPASRSPVAHANNVPDGETAEVGNRDTPEVFTSRRGHQTSCTDSSERNGEG